LAEEALSRFVDDEANERDEALARRAQSGDDDALDGLLRQYRRMAFTRSRAYFVAGAERDDLYQEAMFGLYKAVRDFRAERGVPFRVFARLCIDRQVCSAVRSSSRLKHRHLNRAVSLFNVNGRRSEPDASGDEEVLQSRSELDPLENVLAAESYDELRLAIPALLSPREAEVLELLLAGHGYLAIATMLDQPPKSVDNTLQRIRRKVRTYLEQRNGDGGTVELAVGTSGR
jgi:RNA polymerase sporulation-specific sigma factor